MVDQSTKDKILAETLGKPWRLFGIAAVSILIIVGFGVGIYYLLAETSSSASATETACAQFSDTEQSGDSCLISEEDQEAMDEDMRVRMEERAEAEALEAAEGSEPSSWSLY